MALFHDSVPVRVHSVRGFLFQAVVSAAHDRVAIARGTLERTRTEGGRRYFHDATDAPVRNEYVLLSARYEVHEARWNDVAIEIFHHQADDHGDGAAQAVARRHRPVPPADRPVHGGQCAARETKRRLTIQPVDLI